MQKFHHSVGYVVFDLHEFLVCDSSFLRVFLRVRLYGVKLALDDRHPFSALVQSLDGVVQIIKIDRRPTSLDQGPGDPEEMTGKGVNIPF